MENIILEATETLPAVHFVASSGVLSIKGRSNNERAVDFYEPLIKWAEEYAENPQLKTTVFIELDYINSTSQKLLVGILKKMEKIIEKPDHEVVIKWYYEKDDDDIQDQGLLFQGLFDFTVELIEMEEE